MTWTTTIDGDERADNQSSFPNHTPPKTTPLHTAISTLSHIVHAEQQPPPSKHLHPHSALTTPHPKPNIQSNTHTFNPIHQNKSKPQTTKYTTLFNTTKPFKQPSATVNRSTPQVKHIGRQQQPAKSIRQGVDAHASLNPFKPALHMLPHVLTSTNNSTTSVQPANYTSTTPFNMQTHANLQPAHHRHRPRSQPPPATYNTRKQNDRRQTIAHNGTRHDNQHPPTLPKIFTH